MNKQEIIDYVSHTPFNSNENVLRGMLDQLVNNVKLYQFQFNNLSHYYCEPCASLNNISDFNITVDDLTPNEHKKIFSWVERNGDFTLRYEDPLQDNEWTKTYTHFDFRSSLTHIMPSEPPLFCTHGVANLTGNNNNNIYFQMNFTQGNSAINSNDDKLYALCAGGLSNGSTIKETEVDYVQTDEKMPFTLNILVVEY